MPGIKRSASLSKALAKPVNPRKPDKCKVGVLVDEHPNGMDIDEAVNNLAWPIITLQKVLNDYEIVVGFQVLTKHRRQQCVCFNK